MFSIADEDSDDLDRWYDAVVQWFHVIRGNRLRWNDDVRRAEPDRYAEWRSEPDGYAQWRSEPDGYTQWRSEPDGYTQWRSEPDDFTFDRARWVERWLRHQHAWNRQR